MSKTNWIIAASILAAAPAGAHAQSAYQYNRAAQAIQICASAMGAAIPECAQLRGAVGAPTVSSAETAAAAQMLSGLAGSAVPGAVPGLANGSAAANLFGMAAQAYAASRQQTVPAAPTPVPNGFPGGYSAPAPSGFPSVDYNTASALATQNAAIAYQQCVARVGATNAAGVQGCVQQLAAASGAGAYAGAPAAYANVAGFPGAAPAGVPAGFPQAATAAQAAPLAAAAANAFSALMAGR